MNRILQRFVDVWKMDFLAKFVAGEHKNLRTTVCFWVAFNVLIVLVIVCELCFYLYSAENVLISTINENVPENARISVSMGQLSTENIDEPFFREVTAENEYNADYSEDYVLIIDTHSQGGYDITSLDEYTGGVVVLHDRAYMKNDNEIQHVLFADVPDFSLTREQATAFIDQYFFFPFTIVLSAFAFFALVIFYSVFRLIAVFWWALMLWILAKIMDVTLQYPVAYKAVLNFYFIPTVVVLLLSFVGVHISLLVTAIFMVIFIANLLWIKRHKVEEDKKLSVQKEASETPVKTTEK